jgi:uncharacterized protein (TIGR03437 family)
MFPGATGAIAPGEVLVLEGITIGPSPLVANTIPLQGTVTSALAGVTVNFNYGSGNSAPAPVLYASASQTSVVVPYGLSGFFSASIEVNYRGQQIATPVTVAFSAPGIFTANFSGSGQASALNADGTVNGPTNPASAGSVITIFATGQGPENPPGEDGVVDDRILRTPVLPVNLMIGGQTTQLLYAGSGFGQVQGVMQVQAVIPSGLSGAVPVLLTVGSASSQANVTISVH